VLAANPAYLSLYGYSLEEVIGQNFAIIFPEETRQQAVDLYKEVFAGEVTPATFESVVHRSDGSQRIVESSATFLSEAGRRTAMLSTIRDITERKYYEDALRQLSETLEARVNERTMVLHERELQLQALASRLTMAEQEERRRISQILHDDLQQLLYGIKMQMQSVLEEAKASGQNNLITHARTAHDWLTDAIATTRQLTVDLSPPILKGEGLLEALGWLVNQMATVNGLQVTLDAGTNLPVLHEDMRVLLFQIVRELLFNVHKHAGTDRAVVEVQKGERGELLIQVSDEGSGFDVNAASMRDPVGFGLFSARERLQLFGGRMQIDARLGEGTRVTIDLPIGSP